MKRWWKAPASVLLVASMVLASFPAARAADAASQPAPPRLTAPDESSIALPSTGRVIVKFRKPEAAASVMAVAAQGGQAKPQTNPTRMVVKLPSAPAQARAMIKALRALPNVIYVENDEQMKALDLPNDERFGELWGLQRIHAQDAWPALPDNRARVTVAVVDTGVDDQHPDLAGRVWEGYNAIDQSIETADDNGHGTHVSGTIAGVYNNGIGVTGVVGPVDVKILPVKALGADGLGSFSDVAAGIEWAADNGANVINLSLGGGYSQTVDDAIRYASNRGVVVVAAAGNEHANTAHLSPAGAPGAVTVAAVGQNEWPTWFSNFGAEVEVAAPGELILSTIPGNGYDQKSGTSMATPHVAAVAALIKAAHPEYNRAEVQGCLIASVEKLPNLTPEYGAGLVRADLAVACDVTALPDPYFKLESPNTKQLLRGVTTFTFDANPNQVAAIEVTDADGAVLGTAPVTTDLTDVAVDLSAHMAGNVTLKATALDSNGVTVAAVTGTYRVAGPSYVVKMRDEKGDLAPGAKVALYVEYVENQSATWEYAGTLTTNGDGQIALSNATFPEGHRIMAMAWMSDGSGHPIFRYGILAAPGLLDLNAPLVRTTFDASTVPTTDREFMLLPDGEEYDPMWLYPYGDVMDAWLPEGGYSVIFDSQTDGYFLAQHANVSAAAATITFDLTDTATVTWQPTAGRSYNSARMSLFAEPMHWGLGYDVEDLANGRSITVKQGDYHAYVDFSLLDGDDGVWSYDLSLQPLTVTAGGATVTEGTPKQTIQAYASSSTMPGAFWPASFQYPLMEGGYLYSVYGPAAAGGTSPKPQPNQITVAQERAGQAPRRVTMDARAKSPAMIQTGSVTALEIMEPSMIIVDAAGTTVSNPSDISTTSNWALWNVPAKFPGGSYKAEVALNAGPLGELEAEIPVTVGTDTLADGVLVKVTDAEGVALTDAEVSLLRPSPLEDGHTYWTPVGRSWTDADGYARLKPAALPAGTSAKLSVLYEDRTTHDSYAILRDVTLPQSLAVSLSEAHPVTVMPTDELGAPMANAEIGFAYVDENGDPIFTDYGVQTFTGEATFHLGAGSVRFTATDIVNNTYTLGDPTAIGNAARIVDLPAGELSSLALDPTAQFADGSPMIPEFVYARNSEYPGFLPLAIYGEQIQWRVTPGLYEHSGTYYRSWQDQDWHYDLTGGELVPPNSAALIPVGGAFMAEIGEPARWGSNGYQFQGLFADSHFNRLIGLSSEEIGALAARKEALLTAVQQHDWKTLRQEPAVARLEQGRLMTKVGPELLRSGGVTAKYEPEIAPILTVRDEKGAEVWRDTYWSNWWGQYYYAEAGAQGTYTARIALGIGPEGSIAAETTFDVGSMSLAVSPTLFNPNTMKLTIQLNLPAQDTYSVQIQDERGAKVKDLATNQTGKGMVDLQWDGKNASGKLVPNGTYQAVATTTRLGSLTVFFKLRVPLTPTKPTVTVDKPLVNKEIVTVKGTATSGFALAAQVKGPGQTEWTRFTGLGVADPVDGHFSIGVPLTADDGLYRIQVQGVDPDDASLVSPWSDTVSVTRDTVAPALTLVSPKAAEGVILVNSTKVTFQGTTEAGLTVTATIAEPGKSPVTRTAKADSKGAWKIENAMVTDASSVSLTTADPAGNMAEPQTYDVTVDTEKPSVAIGDDDVPMIQLVMVKNGNATTARPVVDKTGLTFAVSGADVDSFALDVHTTEPLGAAKVSPAVKGKEPLVGANFLYVEIAPNKNGSTSYSIDIYDVAGNKTTLPKVFVKLDSAGPTMTISQPAGTTVLATNTQTAATVELKGSASEVLTAVQVIDTANPDEVLATATPNSKNFAVSVNLPLSEATYQLRVVGYDQAGNASQPGSKDFRTVRVDVTAPEVPQVTAPVPYGTPTGSYLYVNSNSFKLSGTAEPGVTVYAHVSGGNPVTTVAKADGTFSFSIKFTGTRGGVALWAQDAAGNKSDVKVFALQHDKYAPAVPDLSLVVGDTEYSLTMDAKGKWSYPAGTINVLDAESIALSGRSDSRLGKVLVNDKPVPVAIIDTEFTANVASLVKAGANSLTLKVYDQAGNVTSLPVTFTLDAPKVTIAEKDLVTRAGGTTFSFTVTYSESMERFQVIPTLVDGDAGELEIMSQAPQPGKDGSGLTKWKVYATLPATGTGTWTLQFLGIDKQGNSTVIGSAGQDIRRITLDARAPELNVPVPGDEQIYTSMAAFDMIGTVTDQGTGLKSLTVNGSTVTVDSEGNFTKNVKVGEGLTKIEVKATDLAGNVTTKLFQVVRKSKISSLSVSKSGPTGGLLTISGTTDKPVRWADGTAATSVNLQILIKDKSGTVVMTLDPVTAGADGKYSVTGIGVSDLAKGTYTIVVTATVPEFDGVTKTATTTFTVK